MAFNMQLLLFFKQLKLELVIAVPNGVGITVTPMKLIPPSAVSIQLITNRALVSTLNGAVLVGVTKESP